jgi:inner membrane protein
MFGGTMGRAGLNRLSGLATLTLVLSAEAPDVDIAWAFAGPVTAFARHRGFTHTFLGAPVMAALVLGVVWAVDRWRKRRGHEPPLPVRWPVLYGLALLGSLSHILLDFTNNYGVRPLFPFDPRWYHWDIVGIVEPVMLAVLFLGLITPLLTRLIGSEIGARRQRLPGKASAMVALSLIAIMWWVRDYNHRRAVALLASGTYQDAEPIRVAANPYNVNPFVWHGVVETENFFQTMNVDTWNGKVDPQNDARTIFKPEETSYTLAAKKARMGQVYLDWAAFPVTETEILQPESAGVRVRFRDLRYAYPGVARNLLGAWVVLDPHQRVVEQGMGTRSEKSTPPID